VVFHLVFIDVVEHRIDREVSPERVLFGRPNVYDRHTRVLSVLLRPQVHEINEDPVHSNRGGLEVLRLLAA